MNKKELVGYEIVVSSFCDSNGDGIGDIQGIITKLPYLKSLGINAIWLSPFHRSPLVDSGYDVADYYSVDERYGTLKDLKDLIDRAHSLGISVLMDLVLNHTSNQNEWFMKSVNKENGYEDFYIWTKTPNNWISFLGESVWTYNEIRQEYYLHIFAKEQPDLNYANPFVIKTMAEMSNFYLKLGIDGFRLDAVAHLAKDWTFIDSQKCEQGFLDTVPFSNRDEVISYLREWKKRLIKECLIIGEVGGEVSASRSLEYLDKDCGVMDMVFTFDHCWLNGMYGHIVPTDKEDCTLMDSHVFVENYLRYYERFKGHATPLLYWLNHDHPRLVNHYGSLKYQEQSAKMLATLLYFLYGAMFIYYGEEIGMLNDKKVSIDEFIDCEAHHFYQTSTLSKEKKLHHLNRMNRDAARGKMDWNSANEQWQSEDTIWKEYQKIIAFRFAHSKLMHQPNVYFKKTPSKVIEYVREGEEEQLRVIVNVSDEEILYKGCELQGGEFITGSSWKGNKLPPYYYGAYFSKK